jgi:hypothetical protein
MPRLSFSLRSLLVDAGVKKPVTATSVMTDVGSTKFTYGFKRLIFLQSGTNKLGHSHNVVERLTTYNQGSVQKNPRFRTADKFFLEKISLF